MTYKSHKEEGSTPQRANGKEGTYVDSLLSQQVESKDRGRERVLWARTLIGVKHVAKQVSHREY